jgi:hypothetical protein
MDPKKYAQASLKLREQALRVAGLIALNVPDTANAKSEFIQDGPVSALNPMLKGIGDAIDDLMHYYNELQRAMGLDRNDVGRFEHIDKLPSKPKPKGSR